MEGNDKNNYGRDAATGFGSFVGGRFGAAGAAAGAAAGGAIYDHSTQVADAAKEGCKMIGEGMQDAP